MDIERLNRRRRMGIGDAPPAVRDETGIYRRQAFRRAMIMDYLYFVFCVAVMASILGFCWHRFVLKADGRHGRVNTSPIPPVKRVTDSLSERELKRLELQENIDVWQRNRIRRLERDHEEAETPVNGQKYTFVPAAESRAKTIRHRTRIAPRQRFQLIR